MISSSVAVDLIWVAPRTRQSLLVGSLGSLRLWWSLAIHGNSSLVGVLYGIEVTDIVGEPSVMDMVCQASMKYHMMMIMVQRVVDEVPLEGLQIEEELMLTDHADIVDHPLEVCIPASVLIVRRQHVVIIFLCRLEDDGPRTAIAINLFYLCNQVVVGGV